MKMWDANLQVYEKNYFTYLLSCILPSFSKKASRLILSKGLLKCASKIPFRNYKQKGVLLVIYLFNYDSSQSTSFMLNLIFEYGYLSTVPLSWIRFLSNKLEFILIQRLQKHPSFLSLCVLICRTFW